MSYFFIINPNAGKKQGAIKDQLAKAFARRKKHFELEFTRARGHASELAARALIAGFNRVVAVGGDGTIREIAAALIGKEAVLGILPCGSGNGLARNLRIPLGFCAALEGLLQWEPRPIDAGLANGFAFFCAAGAGLDAEIAHDYNSLSRRRGILPYVWYGVRRALTYDARRLIARFDGTTVERVSLLAAVLNGEQYGGGARMAPGASVDDGLLDLCFIKKASLPRLVSALPALFNGRLADHPGIYEAFQARMVELDCGSASWYHLDGEDFFSEDGKIRFSVIPAAIRVLAPKP